MLREKLNNRGRIHPLPRNRKRGVQQPLGRDPTILGSILGCRDPTIPPFVHPAPFAVTGPDASKPRAATMLETAEGVLGRRVEEPGPLFGGCLCGEAVT